MFLNKMREHQLEFVKKVEKELWKAIKNTDKQVYKALRKFLNDPMIDINKGCELKTICGKELNKRETIDLSGEENIRREEYRLDDELLIAVVHITNFEKGIIKSGIIPYYKEDNNE